MSTASINKTVYSITTGGRGPDGAPGTDAEVTTANVTAAGALMDSEVTNLAAVKAFDPADYATDTQGTTADSALQKAALLTGAGTITPKVSGDLDFNDLGGTVDNAAVNAAIAVNPVLTREAAKAETTGIAWLERFARLSDGVGVVESGDTTENGNVINIQFQTGFSAADIVDGGLRAQLGDLFYMGGSVPSPGKRMSLSVVAELRLNPDYNGTGISAAGIILAVGNIPFTSANFANFLGNGCTHIQFSSNGTISEFLWNGSHPEPEPAFTKDREQNNILPPLNKKILLNTQILGEILTASYNHQNVVFRSTGLPEKVSESATGFFVQTGRNVQMRYCWHIHAVWANSPILDNSEFVTTKNSHINEFFSRDKHVLGGRIDLFTQGVDRLAGGNLPATAKIVAGGDSTTVKGGNNRINGGHIFADGGFISNYGFTNTASFCRAPMDFDLGLDAAVASLAATQTTLLAVAGVASLENGDMEVWDFAGNLVGVNAKRIWLYRASGDHTWFDSDADGTPLTAITGPWTMTVRRNVTAAASYITCHFQANGVSLMQRVALNYGNNTIIPSLLTLTTDAGAVTLEFARKTLVRVNNS